jgi:hypothetical protein
LPSRYSDTYRILADREAKGGDSKKLVRRG